MPQYTVTNWLLTREVRLEAPVATPLGGKVKMLFCWIDVTFECEGRKLIAESVRLALPPRVHASRRGESWPADRALAATLDEALQRNRQSIVDNDDGLQKAMWSKVLAGRPLPGSSRIKPMKSSVPASGCAQKGCGCLVLVLLAGFGLYSCMEHENARRAALTPSQRAAEDKTAETEQLKIKVRRVAEGYVRNFLKFPDDASFGWGGDASANPEGDVFGCEGTVRAKNAFGAALTYRWEAIVFLDGDTWRLVTLVIDGKTVVDHDDLTAAIKAKHAKALAPENKRPSLVWRTWTDKAGKHETEAALVRRDKNSVVLRKSDGKEVTVPLDKLSDEDREWLRKNDL